VPSYTVFFRRELVLFSVKLFYLSLLPGHHEGSSFSPSHTSITHSHGILLLYRPKAMGPNNCELKLLKPWAKIHLSSFKVVYLSRFVRVTESWPKSFWYDSAALLPIGTPVPAEPPQLCSKNKNKAGTLRTAESLHFSKNTILGAIRVAPFLPLGWHLGQGI
jgi:hypothetical protein